MNKKMLSAVAASAIALGLIGCGGGSSSSGSSSSSSVTAVDDYIFNARLVAVVYNTDTNKTEEVNGTTDISYKDVTTGKWTKGSATYTKPTLKADQKLLYYKLVPVTNPAKELNAKICGNMKYSCPQTFMDTDGDREYNASKDNLISTTFYSIPSKKVDAAVITPATTLVFSAIDKGIGGTGTNPAADFKAFIDTNVSKISEIIAPAVDGNVSEIAPILGFKTEADLLKSDPMNFAPAERNTYILAYNVLRTAISSGKLSQVLTALKKQPKATSAKDVLSNIAAAAKAANLNTPAVKVVNTILAQTKAGVNFDSLVSTINPGESVKAGALKTAQATVTKDNAVLTSFELTNGTTDTNITDIVGDGFKLNNTISKAKINWVTNSKIADTNITTNKNIDLVVHFRYDKKYVAQSDVNTSEDILAVIPLEINATNNGSSITFNGKVVNSDANKVKIYARDGYNPDVKTKDFELNASALGITNIFDGTTIDVKTIISKVTNAVESNASTNNVADVSSGYVTKLGVYLDDKDDILKYGVVNNNELTAVIPFATAAVESFDGSYKKDLITIVPETYWADWRGSTIAANSKPNYELNVTNNNGLTVLEKNGNNISLNSKDYNGSTIVFNENKNAADKNITFGLGKKDSDTMERLTHIAITSKASGIVKAIGLVNDATGTGDLNGSDSGTFNITVDSNTTNSTYSKGSHPKYVLTYKPTDEFKLAGIERNVTILLNRAPYAELNNTAANFIISNAAGDFNGTSNCQVPTNGASNLSCVALKIEDNDGVADVNNTANVDVNVTHWDLNVSVSGVTCTVGGAAATLSAGQTVTCKDGDGNVTTIGLVPVWTNGNLYVEFNDSNVSTGWNEPAYEANATIQFNDRYGIKGTKKVRFVIK